VEKRYRKIQEKTFLFFFLPQFFEQKNPFGYLTIALVHTLVRNLLLTRFFVKWVKGLINEKGARKKEATKRRKQAQDI